MSNSNNTLSKFDEKSVTKVNLRELAEFQTQVLTHFVQPLVELMNTVNK